MTNSTSIFDAAIEADRRLIEVADDPQVTELVERRIERTARMRDTVLGAGF